MSTTLAQLPYPAIAPEEIPAALRLLRTEGIGPVRFFKLVQRYGSPKAALEALPNLPPRADGSRYEPANAETIWHELETLERMGAQVLPYGGTHYPELLAQIHDPPPLLFAHGRLELLHRPQRLAMVGARNASANGYAFARQLASEAGAAGMLVVSGLARGIDTAAHHAALSTGTVGVIACGLDVVYPPENAPLFDQMREVGVVLTEQPLGFAPQARSFPARNRIISGICHATLVVEASLRSGSLITAECAAEHGREVFAIPGNPLDPRCQGTNKLIKNGAHLVESFEDIAQQWPTELRLAQLSQPSPRRTAHAAPQTDLFAAPLPQPSHTSARAGASPAVGARALVLEKLSPTMVLVDELAEQCNLSAAALQALLVELELEGMILRAAGNRVALSTRT